jgi:hypothetical protein
VLYQLHKENKMRKVIFQKRNCDYCNRYYEGWGQKFCSNKCSNDSRYSIINNLNITPRLHEIIEGTLFSDAGLELDIKNRARNPRYYFKQCEQQKQYCFMIANEFGLLNKIKKQNQYIRRDGLIRLQIDYRFKTSNSSDLLQYYNRWYPNGKKVIPIDFKITPLSLLHIYLGDGYLLRHHSGPNAKYWQPCICTNSFEVEDIENIFIKQLKDIGIESYIKMTKVSMSEKLYPVTHIRTSSCSTFLDYIGQSPIKHFDYKWGLYRKTVIKPKIVGIDLSKMILQ